MKAIILAAGKGTRLGEYTKNLPKGMLSFGGKSLIERQVEILKQGGVTDIIIVKGYEADKITIPGVQYYTNEKFNETNMVATLMCARQEMDGDFLVCYSDILYEPRVLKIALESSCEVGVTVDMDYQEYWHARLDNAEDDQESFVMDGDRIVQIGTPNPPKDQLHGRYVGLIRFSKKGGGDLQRVYDKELAAHGGTGKRWYHSTSVETGCMTDMLQAMIDDGVELKPIRIERGWLEFDTMDDYERYQLWVKQGSMGRFFDLPGV